MGSGSSGSYSGAVRSQPYAETYHVCPGALKRDMKNPYIYDPQTGYFKNPNAINLNDAIQGNSVYLNGLRPNGPITYVMDTNGNIILGKRCNPNKSSQRAPHPTLIGGKDPEVQVAGMITFIKGKIYTVDNQSGHYRPNIRSMEKIEKSDEKTL